MESLQDTEDADQLARNQAAFQGGCVCGNHKKEIGYWAHNLIIVYSIKLVIRSIHIYTRGSQLSVVAVVMGL